MILYITVSVLGQLLMWSVTARILYRNWEWEEKTAEDSRQGLAGLWGFLWPLSCLLVVLVALGTLIGWAETAPSLGERREKKKAARREHLENLNHQIETAEAELEAVTKALADKEIHDDPDQEAERPAAKGTESTS